MNENRLVLIGSTGQNSGKTTLAKEIIGYIRSYLRRYSCRAEMSLPIVALKITCVEHVGAACRRGGAGCGACSNIDAEYGFSLEEEFAATKDSLATGSSGTFGIKDTAALLEAGASRSFWLRSFYSNLAAGYAAFLQQIPQNALIICESNSLRTIIEPALFIMLDNTKNAPMKPSAARVIDLADIRLPAMC